VVLVCLEWFLRGDYLLSSSFHCFALSNFQYKHSLDFHQGNLNDNLDNVCKQSQVKINARHFKNLLSDIFMGLKKPLSEIDIVDINLKFKNAGKVSIRIKFKY
jgi:hypothetical protein